MLRVPTFEALERMVREAETGAPYHVVHSTRGAQR
jgi:hypothetical protein